MMGGWRRSCRWRAVRTLGLKVEEEVAGLRVQLPMLVRLESPGAVRPLLPRLIRQKKAARERLLLEQVDVRAPLRPVDQAVDVLPSREKGEGLLRGAADCRSQFAQETGASLAERRPPR